MSHTPGPWFDDGYRVYAPTDNADKRTGRVIVEYKHVDDFNAADGPLITAAPDLLDALYEVLDVLPDCDNKHAATVLAHVNEAIAKAEGK